jgi:hypothetical protein
MVIVGDANEPGAPFMPLYIDIDLKMTPGAFFFVVPVVARGLGAVLMSSSFLSSSGTTRPGWRRTIRRRPDLAGLIL